ncbi:unnamed protein product, partial [Mesorhabditis spiculigera]
MNGPPYSGPPINQPYGYPGQPQIPYTAPMTMPPSSSGIPYQMAPPEASANVLKSVEGQRVTYSIPINPQPTKGYAGFGSFQGTTANPAPPTCQITEDVDDDDEDDEEEEEDEQERDENGQIIDPKTLAALKVQRLLAMYDNQEEVTETPEEPVPQPPVTPSPPAPTTPVIVPRVTLKYLDVNEQPLFKPAVVTPIDEDFEQKLMVQPFLTGYGRVLRPGAFIPYDMRSTGAIPAIPQAVLDKMAEIVGEDGRVLKPHPSQRKRPIGDDSPDSPEPPLSNRPGLLAHPDGRGPTISQAPGPPQLTRAHRGPLINGPVHDAEAIPRNPPPRRSSPPNKRRPPPPAGRGFSPPPARGFPPPRGQRGGFMRGRGPPPGPGARRFPPTYRQPDGPPPRFTPMPQSSSGPNFPPPRMNPPRQGPPPRDSWNRSDTGWNGEDCGYGSGPHPADHRMKPQHQYQEDTWRSSQNSSTEEEWYRPPPHQSSHSECPEPRHHPGRPIKQEPVDEQPYYQHGNNQAHGAPRQEDDWDSTQDAIAALLGGGGRFP